MASIQKASFFTFYRKAIQEYDIKVTDASDSELYTLLGIRFQDKNGKTKYGCACKSNRNKASVFFDEPSPYEYIYEGDSVGSKKQSYESSKVKIASWKCSEYDNQLSEFKMDKCYYRYFDDDKFEQEIDLNITNLIEDYCLVEEKFYEVMYEKPPGYYQKLIFVLTICLPYYAMFGFGLNEITIFLAYYVLWCTFQDENKINYPSPFVKNKTNTIKNLRQIVSERINGREQSSSDSSSFTNSFEDIEYKSKNKNNYTKHQLKTQNKINTQNTKKIAQPQKENSKKKYESKFQAKLDLQQNNKSSEKELLNQVIASEEYDPLKIPADLNKAIEHSQAWAVGYDINSKKSQKNLNLCECCGRQIQKQQFDLSCDVTEFSYLGAVYGAYTNLDGDDCIDVDSVPESQRDEICHLNWITMSTLGNKYNNDAQMNIQQVLNFITIIIVIISLQLFRRQIRITEVQCDQLDINSSDFTILVKNIPRVFQARDYDKEIQNLFELVISKLIYKNQIGKKLKIEKLSLCYDTSQQNEVEQEKKQLVQVKKQLIKDDLDTQEIDLKLKQLELKQDQIEQDYIQGQSESTKKLFSGWAFLSFKTEQEKNEVLYFFGEQPPSLFFCCKRQKRRQIRFRQNKLKIDQAPDCEDVYWENLHYTSQQKMKRRIIGKIILLFALILCLSIITGLKYLQKSISNQDNPDSTDIMISQIFAILIGGGITVFNKVLQFTFQYVSIYEKYSTRTEEILTVAKGLTVAQFFVTGLLTFLVDIFITDLLTDNSSFSLIFRTGGLAYNIYFVFFTNAFVEPIINYINFPYLLKKFKRYYIEKQEAENVGGKGLLYTQEELNQIYENPQPKLSYLYASIIKTMYFTAFYCVLEPLGIIISIIGLILTYYVEKDYARENPATKQYAKQQFYQRVEKLKKKNFNKLTPNHVQ
ncbi:hypothetical protein PPERSA_09870 [Pseudocohnilembus persalinus]|uniref:CSC1/OSCA1-like cytosolic domain-containing protein n=1 Tax=Pseudocohnilembus persalinus TaxID=266149 RepID=A0A0V0QU01_PSEPJ|nr:hypothetical protein PPERSA_09870 [Pseudocohnilembus persalinus]|eukprot:KRX05730.1 hypothetical protein PPERSA_09870 [Pseudocohnilembus persalinus]